jgi:hypothetical protein
MEACSAGNWLRAARRLIVAGKLGAARVQADAVRRKRARRLPAKGLGDRVRFALSPSSNA